MDWLTRSPYVTYSGIRAQPNDILQGFDNGRNSAILRYKGAPTTDPTTPLINSTMPMVETNLHVSIMSINVKTKQAVDFFAGARKSSSCTSTMT